MTREELEQHGLNQSITHVDFMIGSEEMDIDGVTDDGSNRTSIPKGQLGFLKTVTITENISINS